MVDLDPVPPLDSLTCEAARDLQAQLVAGEIDSADRRLLVAHSNQCASCKEELGDSLVMASSGMGIDPMDQEERWAVREAYALARREPRRVSSGGKRLLLYVLAAVLLVFGSSLEWFGDDSTRLVGGSPRLTAVRGKVYLSDALLVIGEATVVPVGRVIELGPRSSALLERGSAQIEVVDSTALQVEAHDPLSVNLVHGWTRCVGPCRVRTPLGLVVCDAGDEVLILVTESLVTLEGMDGETIVSSTTLTETITRGQVLRLER